MYYIVNNDVVGSEVLEEWGKLRSHLQQLPHQSQVQAWYGWSQSEKNPEDKNNSLNFEIGV